ncbi:MAG: chorismate mutase [Clostridiales bacterium]|nr:chorismate mutase [Clostridiales bacterium]
MDLSQLREEINAIDDQIAELVVKRLDVNQQVAAYKIEHDLPVLQPDREQAVLDRAAAKSGDYADALRLVFATLMDMGRATQHRIIGGGDNLRKELEEARACAPELDGGVVACQGVDGAFSSEAALKRFPWAELTLYQELEDGFAAVRDGKAKFGVVPVENSITGSVHEVYDLMMKFRFHVAGAVDLPIRQCLCARSGAALEDIRQVYSMNQGLSQCSEFIKQHGLEARYYSNTAAAAQFVSESERTDIAAICSRHAAKRYGLEVLCPDIQARQDNTTRFLVISRKLMIEPGADKISVIFAVPHTTGSLYRVLGRFSMFGLNLTKLESRPGGGENFTYHFYLDLQGDIWEEKTMDLLCTLCEELPYFTLLGNYKELC